MSINHLVRANILSLEPYQSARRIGGIGDIWLNANEYPLAQFYNLRKSNFNRYPDCQPNNVINNYANYAEILPEQILVCRGADEGIDLLIRTFCEPKIDAILFFPPTYNMYSISAEIFGAIRRPIVLNKNWQLNLSIIATKLDGVKLIYICNPNNPTGNLINQNDLKNLLDMTKGRAIVIIDEAYIDFYPQASLVSWLSVYEHLVILRTLSKAFALAGLRCGFVLANVEIIQLLLKLIAPYPIAIPIADIAEQALSIEGLQTIRSRVAEINVNRKLMIQDLKRCPCVDKIFPSFSNYVLVRFNPIYQVFRKLCNKGIILRDQSKQYGLNNCLRITVGTKNECYNLITALKMLNPSS